MKMVPPLAPFVFARPFSPFRGEFTSSGEPLSVLNVEKLSLSPSTPVGTQAAISDAFSIGGSGTSEANVFFRWTSDFNGKGVYQPVKTDPDNDARDCYWYTAGAEPYWVIHSSNGEALYLSEEDVQYPWQVTVWLNAESDPEFLAQGEQPSPTLTHPAIQVLVPPDSSQGGVAVIGGTQDGVYYANGPAGDLDRTGYVILGETPSSDSAYQIRYFAGSLGPTADVDGWSIYNNDTGSLYYSLSDTLTPDLASSWKNTAGDTPASITVTSVSVGELYAGLFVSNDGVTNGSSYVSQPFHGRQYYMGLNGGGSNNMHWDTDFNVWTDDVGVLTTDNVAFPSQGTNNGGGHTGATFSMNHVANERNWANV